MKLVVVSLILFNVISVFGQSSTSTVGIEQGKQNQDGTREEDESKECGGSCIFLMTAIAMACFAVITLTALWKKRRNGALKKQEEKSAKERADLASTLEEMRTKLKFLEERIRQPYETLLKISRDQNAMTVDQLKTWSVPNSKSPITFGMKAKLYEAELISKHSLDTPIDSRYISIPTLKQTQIVVEKPNQSYGTTFNAMLDFFGSQILVGQAPIATRIAEHWSAMYQENIGVIVWIGPMKDSMGNEKIFPYIPMVARQSLSFKQFKVTKKEDLVTEKGFQTYKIQIEVERDENKTRQMTVFSVSSWPEFNSMAKTIELVNALKEVAFEQKIRMSEGLPTIAVHCSNGIGDSTAFVTAYIERQMLLYGGTVDPLAILDYIRHHRYLPLTNDFLSLKLIKSQMAVVGSILYYVGSRMSKKEGKETPETLSIEVK